MVKNALQAQLLKAGLVDNKKRKNLPNKLSMSSVLVKAMKQKLKLILKKLKRETSKRSSFESRKAAATRRKSIKGFNHSNDQATQNCRFCRRCGLSIY